MSDTENPHGHGDPAGDAASGLFGALFADAEVERHIGDRALVRAMLDVEVALARVEAAAGLVPADAADAISACADRADLDIAQIAKNADATGNPVVPLVEQLGRLLPSQARPWLHHGATSQDVLDTALMIVARQACAVIVERLHKAADAAASLAQEHRDTVMIARTLGQQAIPTTFGLKAAGWLVALDEATDELEAVVRTGLAVQFGGAAGNLGLLGEPGVAIMTALAGEIGLAEPAVPWHVDRGRIMRLAAALAAACATVGKISLDVVLLSQTEIGEVVADADGRGGSSAMPHKANPIDAVLARSAAARAPGLLSTLYSAAAQHEHERAAGAWHAEWQPLRELLSITGGASARAAAMLARLRVSPQRMRANLDASGGLPMAEHVAALLAPDLGRSAAHQLVARCCAEATRAGRPLRDVLLAEPDVTAHASAAQVDDALDPTRSLAAAAILVDRALTTHGAARRGERP